MVLFNYQIEKFNKLKLLVWVSEHTTVPLFVEFGDNFVCSNISCQSKFKVLYTLYRFPLFAACPQFVFFSFTNIFLNINCPDNPESPDCPCFHSFYNCPDCPEALIVLISWIFLIAFTFLIVLESISSTSWFHLESIS